MPLPTDPALLALSNRVIEQFDTIFGVHPGFRPVHAKGVMLSGTFSPTPEAAEVTRAPHMNQASTRVRVRFSDSTGLPLVPDNDPGADPRGMAVRFHLGERVHTDIVAHSVDAFPAHTGEEFLEFLQAVAATLKATPGAHPTPVEKYVAAHPATLAFIQAIKPGPVSFARDSYFSVSALRFIKASGVARYGRYRIIPAAGEAFLDAATYAARGLNYLFDELNQRLSTGPIEFTLAVQLAENGDVVDNATVRWPADRTVIALGTLRLTDHVPNDTAEQKRDIFDPVPRVDGIEASADPLFDLRAAVYLLSGRRRRAASVLKNGHKGELRV